MNRTYTDLDEMLDEILDKDEKDQKRPIAYVYLFFRRLYKFPRNICNEIRWAWQRVFRGWDDRVIWGIDQYLSETFPVWLRKLKCDSSSVPLEFVESDFDEGRERWGVVLEEIASGFDAAKRIIDSSFWMEEQETFRIDTKLFERGMYLLSKHYFDLWD